MAAPAAEAVPGEKGLPFSPAVGCLLSVLAGLACAAAFFLILRFNQQGQIVYAPEPQRALRVWLLRGAEGRGIGISTTRPIPGATADRVCAETRVGFFFLGPGVPQADTSYCECFSRAAAGWVFEGACPK
jgi:hypothetical protein